MLYSEITYISGKRETIMFQDQDEANSFYNSMKNYLRNDSQPSPIIEVYDNGQEALINILNIEKVSKPKRQ